VPRVQFGVACGLLFALAIGRPLGAQGRSVLELGASVIRFSADSVTTGGPSLRWTASGDRSGVAGSLSMGGVAGAGGASGFLDLSGRRRHGLPGGWRAELGGELGALVATGARASSNHASSGLLSATLIRPLGSAGVWLRGTGSLAKRDPDLIGGRGVDAGAWWGRPGVHLVATLGREWTAAQLFAEENRIGYLGTVPVEYTEATLGIMATRDNASLSLTGVARRDPGAERLVERGFIAAASYWQTPRRAFVISVVSQLPDFVRGADAAQSITIGLRLNEPSPAFSGARQARPLVFVAGDSAERIISVRAPSARRVEVMGDFSDWEPLSLAPAGDLFVVRVAMSPGTRRLVVRIDGGEWVAAANTPAVDDDLGGRVGLVLVP
jgi:hypothetical protein